MKTRSRTVFRLSFLVLSLTVVAAQQVERPASDEEFTPVFSVSDYGDPWRIGDSDGDGVTDYALRLDERGEKRYEAMDFNFDGMMDDFYFYVNGVLDRQQLDSNFDGAIDLWIYMHDGVRIRGYERDTDYDGVIDIERDFGES